MSNKNFMKKIPDSLCKTCDKAMRLDKNGNVCCEYNCKCLGKPLGNYACPLYCKGYEPR